MLEPAILSSNTFSTLPPPRTLANSRAAWIESARLLRRTTPRRRRRKGAQPGNSNALKHGFYASRPLLPGQPAHRHRFTHIDLLEHSAILASRIGQIDFVARQLQILEVLLQDAFIECRGTVFGPQTFLNLYRFYRIVSASLKVKLALKRLLDERDFFPCLAKDALGLCTSEFTDRKIHPYPAFVNKTLFVPHLQKNNREITDIPLSLEGRGQGEGRVHSRARPEQAQEANQTPSPVQGEGWGGGPRHSSSFTLTHSQWALLEPLLTFLRLDLAALDTRLRRRPYEDRFLLDAILTKLAFGLGWDELGPLVPVRACQLLYRYLCRSGSMIILYTLLHDHLAREGTSSLETLARDDAFERRGSRVALSDIASPSWENLTGLLLLQRALVNRRRRERLQTQRRLKRRPAPQRTNRSRASAHPRSVFRRRSLGEAVSSAIAHSGDMSRQSISLRPCRRPSSLSPLVMPPVQSSQPNSRTTPKSREQGGIMIQGSVIIAP